MAMWILLQLYVVRCACLGMFQCSEDPDVPKWGRHDVQTP